MRLAAAGRQKLLEDFKATAKDRKRLLGTFMQAFSDDVLDQNNPIPERYRDPRTSGKNLLVEAGKQNILTWDIQQ